MKKILILCCLFSKCYEDAVSQDLNRFKARNALYLEGFGPGGLYSVNYDRILIVRSRNSFGLRFGFGIFGESLRVNKSIAELYTITGKSNHHAELGLAGVLGNRQSPINIDTREQLRVHLVPTIAYRYQKPGGGLLFKIGLTPFFDFSWKKSFQIYPWGGISLGKSF